MKNCSPLSNVHILPSEFCISVHNDSNCPILDNYDKNKKDFESGSICIPPIFLLKASTLVFKSSNLFHKWDRIFKTGPSQLCGRQPLRNMIFKNLIKQTISLQIFQRLSSTNFTWCILEYFVPNINNHIQSKKLVFKEGKNG